MRGFKKWGSPKNGEFDHEKNDLTIKNRDLTMKKKNEPTKIGVLMQSSLFKD